MSNPSLHSKGCCTGGRCLTKFFLHVNSSHDVPSLCPCPTGAALFGKAQQSKAKQRPAAGAPEIMAILGNILQKGWSIFLTMGRPVAVEISRMRSRFYFCSVRASLSLYQLQLEGLKKKKHTKQKKEPKKGRGCQIPGAI